MAESRLRVIVETQDRELTKLQGDLKKTDKAVEDLNGANKKLSRSFRGVNGAAGKAANGIGKTGRAAQTANGQLKGLQATAGRLLGTLGLLGAGRFIFGKTAEIERTTKQLATVTGSLETAKDVLKDLQVINKKSPFSFIDLADTAKRLSAFGIANKDLVGSTERLGKAAAATGASVNDLALAYGQVAAKGKLQTEELYQFQERGIPLLDELAKGYGKTTAEVQDLISKGRVGFPAVEQAIKNLTTADGKFAKSFENTADTLDAKLSNAIDSLGRAAAAFGELLKPTVLEALKGAEKLLTDITGVLKSIPQPAVNAALKFGELALKMLAVKKAIDLVIGLKAGLSTMLLGVAGNATTAGNASAIAAGKVTALATALRNLAAIGIVTVGVNYVVNNAGALLNNTAQLEQLRGRRKTGAAKRFEGETREQGINRVKVAKATITSIDKETKALENKIQVYKAVGRAGSLFVRSEVKRLAVLKARRIEAYQNLNLGIPAAPKKTTQDNPFKLEDPKLDGGGSSGGSSGGGATPKPATDDLRALQGQIDLKRELMRLTGQQVKAEMAGDESSVRRLEGEKQLVELKYSTADAMASLNTEEGKALQATLSQLEATEIQANTVDDLAQIEKARTEAIQGALLPLQQEGELLQAQLEGREEEVALRQEAARIAAATPGLEAAQVEVILRTNKALEEQVALLERNKQAMSELASGISSELGSAFKSVIQGTKTTQEAFADMFQGIADKFLDMALQILQDAITQQLIKLFSSLFSSGANPASGSFLGSSGNGFGQLFGDYSSFGGMFADGGTLGAGKWGIAGEAGPELISGPATITPASQMGGGGDSTVVNITINNEGNGSRSSSGSDAQEAARLGRLVERATLAVINREKRPGGTLRS